MRCRAAALRRDRGGDERRQERGDAGLGEAADDGVPGGLVGVHHVVAEIAVDLEVDEAAGEQAVRQADVGRLVRRALPGLGDHAVHDADVSRGEYAGRTAPGGNDHAVGRDQ